MVELDKDLKPRYCLLRVQHKNPTKGLTFREGSKQNPFRYT